MSLVREPAAHEESLFRRHRRQHVVHLPDSDDVIDRMPTDLRLEVARTWTRRAHEELRVAWDFSLLCRELLELGSDPDVLAVVARGVHDEVRHAEVCRSLAERYAGGPVPWPTEVPSDTRPRSSDPRLRTSFHLVTMCCVTESIASAFLDASLKDASSPSARVAVGELLADEVVHARVGWTFLARQPRPMLDAIEANLRALVEPVVRGWWQQGRVTLPEGAPEHGIPSMRRTQEATLGAMREIVLPGFTEVGLDVSDVRAWLDRWETTWGQG